MVKKKEDAISPKLKPRLTREQRLQMLACLLSDKHLFSTAKLSLKTEYINQPDEGVLRAVWRTAAKLADSYGPDFLFDDRPKAWNVLDTEVKTYFGLNPGELSSFEDTCQYLNWLYGQCKPEEFSAKYGMDILTAFLRERAVNDAWQTLSKSMESAVVTNMGDMARVLVEREQDISALSFDPVESGAPEGWLPAPTMMRPTGLGWFDSLLRGGIRAPEVYGICGAYGAGKTTLGLQLCLAVAEMEAFLASGGDAAAEALDLIGLDPLMAYLMGHVYYFHYEMPKDEIRKKLWSCAAMIDLIRIELMGKPGFSLSTTANLSVKELEVLKKVVVQFGLPGFDLQNFPGEQERLARAKKTLNRNFFQIDMTGSTHPGVGKGEIPEIAAILRNEVAKGRRPALVVIDYAMACVERNTSDKDAIYQQLSTFGRRCEHEIGTVFNTPVVVLQQLSGASNSKTASSKQHHSDAAGSKRFGENCWFCFNLGTTDQESGCRYLTVSKARRADLGSPPILKIAGGFNRLVDMSTTYFFDKSGKIKEKGKQKDPGLAGNPQEASNVLPAIPADAPPSNLPVNKFKM